MNDNVDWKCMHLKKPNTAFVGSSHDELLWLQDSSDWRLQQPWAPLLRVLF